MRSLIDKLEPPALLAACGRLVSRCWRGRGHPSCFTAAPAGLSKVHDFVTVGVPPALGRHLIHFTFCKTLAVLAAAAERLGTTRRTLSKTKR